MIKQVSSLSIQGFVLLKYFNINVRPPLLTEFLVIWFPPMVNWIKGNIDGVSVSTPNMAACGGSFRGHHAKHLGRSSCFLRKDNALYVEFMGAILAIKHVLSKI